LILLLLFINQVSTSGSDWINQLNKTIKENGQNWVAGESWVTKLSPEERANLLGEFMVPPENAAAKLITLEAPKSLPTYFTWTNNKGNWVTPVKDQTKDQVQCGSCWAFSATAQVESWWQITNNDTSGNIDLSEQFIISCGDAGDCDGGFTYKALDFFQNNGVPSESCLPYSARSAISCLDACPNWADEAITIPGWGFITLEEDVIDNIKAAVCRHPVSASYQVYNDFYAYSSGVYEHKEAEGEESGGHAILIVGWDDNLECWICKNSWGANWGENGYFRIKWHNCGMGSYMPFIYSEMIGGPALSASPDHLEFSLLSGDSSEATITLNNLSSNTLEFSAIDFQVQYAWHPDTTYAFEGKSWWCAKPEIGGYENGWLQYLETPVIDLSSTSAPCLQFRGNWSVENPANPQAPYDGWDGCNVWVSIDGGNTFTTATPGSPAYSSESLWSFGDSEQGWGMGPGIPGWTGSSNGWVAVDFDLTPFIPNNVVIRWAFASDMGYCSIDDPSLTGFLIDNIVVKDGTDTLFVDYGDDIDSMIQYGKSGYFPVSWLDILHGGGTIPPNSSTDITLRVNTKGMKPGKYHANIQFTSNDTTQSTPVIPCDLDVLAAEHDIYVSSTSMKDSYPIQSTIPIKAEVSNFGLTDESNIDAICKISRNGNIIYSDTYHIEHLEAGNSITAIYKSFYAPETGILNIEISAPLSGDANKSNNYYCNAINITNLIDDFEIANDLWTCAGPVRMSNLVKAHSGAYVLSMGYSSRTPSILTYKPGFNLEGLNYASISYWVQYYTDKNKDYCYIEASSDSLNWTKLDSLTGIQEFWVEHNTDLSYFINNNYPKVWVRFHFVVTGTSGLYFAIDDVSFYNQDPSSEIFVDNNTIPSKWKLEQNYPNPFNPNTTINYSLPQNCFVKITIYDISGREIKVIKNELENAGYKSVIWNGTDNSNSKVPSGVYIYSIEAKDYRANRKMLLLK
ncbi:MAG TPA: hypothetical protein DHW42_09915, partial [Candidatus Marinimicrobia bacterium]|nr:hypothetical protein [Candidatus Neomarinimicrobiota bacterium]